jgi:hypothetical protein
MQNRLVRLVSRTPRHATPRHATPRHATPRHATPRHATPLPHAIAPRTAAPPPACAFPLVSAAPGYAPSHPSPPTPHPGRCASFSSRSFVIRSSTCRISSSRCRLSASSFLTSGRRPGSSACSRLWSRRHDTVTACARRSVRAALCATGGERQHPRGRGARQDIGRAGSRRVGGWAMGAWRGGGMGLRMSRRAKPRAPLGGFTARAIRVWSEPREYSAHFLRYRNDRDALWRVACPKCDIFCFWGLFNNAAGNRQTWPTGHQSKNMRRFVGK